MNKFNCWYVKFLDNRIQKYEHYIERCKMWVRKDDKIRQKYWNKLNLKDRIDLGYELGYTVKGKREKCKTTKK